MWQQTFGEVYRSRMLDINIVSLSNTHSVGNYFIILMKFHHSHRLFAADAWHDIAILRELRDCHSSLLS